MIKIIKNHLLSEEYDYPKKLFRTALYLWPILNYSYLLTNAQWYWGGRNYYATFSSSGFYLLLELFPSLRLVPIVVPLIGILAGILGIIFIRSSILPPVIYYIVLSLDHNSYMLDGGNILARIFLFYNCFLFFDLNKFSDKFRFVSNLAFYLCRIQVVIVYLVAGLSKLAGTTWTSGQAIYYVLSTDSVTTGWFSLWVQHSHELFIIIPTYFILAYQLSFPIGIWFKRSRPFYIFIGSLIHLGMIVIMGLVGFGFIMIVGYLSFFDRNIRLVPKKIIHHDPKDVTNS